MPTVVPANRQLAVLHPVRLALAQCWLRVFDAWTADYPGQVTATTKVNLMNAPVHFLPSGGPDGERKYDEMPQESQGERICRLRRAKGFSQADLAAMLNVSTATICYWEADRSQPRKRRRKLLCELLGIAELELPEHGAIGRLHEVIENARHEIARAAYTIPANIKIAIEM